MVDSQSPYACNHLPLFTRFRQSLRETRSLIETPGHLAGPGEEEEGTSILVVSVMFSWDCGVFVSSGRDALFVSQDEWGRFASQDKDVVQSAQAWLMT